MCARPHLEPFALSVSGLTSEVLSVFAGLEWMCVPLRKSLGSGHLDLLEWGLSVFVVGTELNPGAEVGNTFRIRKVF